MVVNGLGGVVHELWGPEVVFEQVFTEPSGRVQVCLCRFRQRV